MRDHPDCFGRCASYLAFGLGTVLARVGASALTEVGICARFEAEPDEVVHIAEVRTRQAHARGHVEHRDAPVSLRGRGFAPGPDYEKVFFTRCRFVHATL